MKFCNFAKFRFVGELLNCNSRRSLCKVKARALAMNIVALLAACGGPDFSDTVPENTNCAEWYKGYRENLFSEMKPEKIFEFGENILYNGIFPPGFTPQKQFRANWADLHPESDDIQSIMGLIWYGYTKDPGVIRGFSPRTIEAFMFIRSTWYIGKYYPQIYPLCRGGATTYTKCYQELIRVGAIDSLDKIRMKIERAEAQGEVALCRYSEKREPRP